VLVHTCLWLLSSLPVPVHVYTFFWLLSLLEFDSL
jgi:hypothetical protein